MRAKPHYYFCSWLRETPDIHKFLSVPVEKCANIRAILRYTPKILTKLDSPYHKQDRLPLKLWGNTNHNLHSQGIGSPGHGTTRPPLSSLPQARSLVRISPHPLSQDQDRTYTSPWPGPGQNVPSSRIGCTPSRQDLDKMFPLPL